MADWDTMGVGGQGSAANGGNGAAAGPSWRDSWSSLLGMTPSAYQADPYGGTPSGRPQVVSRQAVGGTRYQQVKLGDGSTEFRDENDQPVSADEVRYAMQGVGQSTGSQGASMGPVTSSGLPSTSSMTGTVGGQVGDGLGRLTSSMTGQGGNLTKRSSMPSWYSLLGMGDTIGDTSTSGNGLDGVTGNCQSGAAGSLGYGSAASARTVPTNQTGRTGPGNPRTLDGSAVGSTTLRGSLADRWAPESRKPGPDTSGLLKKGSAATTVNLNGAVVPSTGRKESSSIRKFMEDYEVSGVPNYLTEYDDGYHNPTIGYGHTGADVYPG